MPTGSQYHRGELVRGRRTCEGNGQSALQTAASAHHAPLQGCNVGQDAARIGEQDLAAFSERHTAGMPPEKLQAKLRLERLELLAQRWLLDPELLGGAADVACVSDCNEIAKLA